MKNIRVMRHGNTPGNERFTISADNYGSNGVGISTILHLTREQARELVLDLQAAL